MKRFIALQVLIIMISSKFLHTVFSQENNYTANPVTLNQYLSGVLKGNLGYIAARFGVSMAEAELKASRVFPDPALSISYTNNEERRLHMGQSVYAGLSYPVSLGNKRKASIAFAKSRYELSQMVLESYFQNLRADAALSYFVCVRDKMVCKLQEEIYQQLFALARVDSLRLVTGEAAFLDALQSSLEARSQKANVLQSLTDFRNSLLNLQILQGKRPADTMDMPADTFPVRYLKYSLAELIDNAVEKRVELLVAIKNREVAEKNLNLLKANRAFEFSLETGYSYNTIVRNEIAPAPAFNALSAGITFPVKFSNLNKGPLMAAEIAIRQNQIYYEEAELQIRTEVIKAYNNFIAQSKKVENFRQGLIEDAARILRGRTYSYQRGESGLIDVLNAQRTYIELQLSYIDALFQYTQALIELERAAGIWDF